MPIPIGTPSIGPQSIYCLSDSRENILHTLSKAKVRVVRFSTPLIGESYISAPSGMGVMTYTGVFKSHDPRLIVSPAEDPLERFWPR